LEVYGERIDLSQFLRRPDADLDTAKTPSEQLENAVTDATRRGKTAKPRLFEADRGLNIRCPEATSQ
jgi:hypothetical protein